MKSSVVFVIITGIGKSSVKCTRETIAADTDLSQPPQSNVPRLYSANQTLARWVDLQRQQHRRWRDGKSNGMTDRRIELLEKVGFVWNVYDSMWRTSFQELKNHVKTNGLGRPPPITTPLGRWLVQQKRLYARLLKGEKVTLNDERLSLLRSLGFLV